MNYLLMMMGGSGTRFGADIPKQFVEVNGKPVFSYIVEKYATMDSIDGIVAVCHGEWIEYTQEWAKKVGLTKMKAVVKGGTTRSGSVLNGLIKLYEIGSREDAVLIHDATHPYVDIDGVNEIIDRVSENVGVTLGAREYDTVYRMDAASNIVEVVPREQIVSGASPEAFQLGRLYDIYTGSSIEELDKMTSAGALALANDMNMAVVPTDLINLKITHKQDMEVFEKLFYGYYF